jgi:hypothetical protein
MTSQLVNIELFPQRIFLERGILGQSVNFEFRLQSTSQDTMELQELTVSGFDQRDRLLFRLPLNNWGIVPSILVVSERKLEPGKTLEIFNPLAEFSLDFPFRGLRYEFDFRTDKGTHARPEVTVDPMIYEQRANLSLPFTGLCLVTDGHDFMSHHRRNFPLTHPLIQQIGITGNNSRFAYDFVPIDGEFRMFKNTPHKCEDFFCWGKPVMSPGEGIISGTANGLPDNPLYEPPPFDEEAHLKDPETTLEKHLGNFAIIDHGNNEFSLLAHMQQGSVQVGLGDRVSEGELIGRIGNSGDSGSPHIHYQLQNGADLLKSEGLPSKFRTFQLILGDKTKRFDNSCPNTGMVIRYEKRT